nr:hypothetical protein [uncultured Peptoniphilus sp.]
MTHFTRKKALDQRFSLHDARIIAMERRGDDLFLKTDYGYIDLEKNDGVNGDLLFTDVSFDDSYVYMMDFGRVENIGCFSGEKMTLEDFLPRFEADAAIEVYSEYDGFRAYYVKGFYCLGEEVSEITLDFYFTGSVEYVVYE